MAETDDMIFDTREATRSTSIRIISNQHPEGQHFTIRAMGAGEYLKLIELYQKVETLQDKNPSPKTLLERSTTMEDFVIPMISPSDEFKQWAEATKRDGALAYHRVMLAIVHKVVDLKIEVDGSGE